MKLLLRSVTMAVMLATLAGCGKHQDKASSSGPHLHVDVPPHGGTLTALEDEYQIEWVLDAPAGKLQAYILDGEVENFVRIAPPSFDLRVKLPDRREVLHFKAIPNSATGETVGSTSLFEAQADWLKTNKTFDAVLPEINVEGTVYTNVAFNFPKGNDTDEKK
jgi:hypothetical protein